MNPGGYGQGGYPSQQPPTAPYAQGTASGYPPQQQPTAPPSGYPSSQPPYAPSPQTPQQPPYPGGQPMGAPYPGGQPQQAPYPGGQPQQPPYPGGGGGGYPPQGQGMAPPQQGPPPGVSAEIWGWFRAVDADGSGQISATELQPALTNGNWKPFQLSTCHALVAMFDRDHSGTIGVQEFSTLWDYINQWKRTFESFDRDRSGSIGHGEMSQALQSFGYRLGPNTVTNIMLRYDKRRTGAINFEDFIVACAKLQALTQAFQTKDVPRQGSATIRYEDYLECMCSALLDGIGNR